MPRTAGPIILLSSPRKDLRELGPIWTDEHRRWTLGGANREYVLINETGHALHRERPADVVAAIQRILSRRSDRR